MTKEGIIIYLTVFISHLILNIYIHMDLYESYENTQAVELTPYRTNKRTKDEQYTPYVDIMPKVTHADVVAMLRVVAMYLVPCFMVFNGICAFVLLVGVLLFAYSNKEWFTVVLSAVLLIVEFVGFGLYLALLKYNKEVFNETR